MINYINNLISSFYIALFTIIYIYIYIIICVGVWRFCQFYLTSVFTDIIYSTFKACSPHTSCHPVEMNQCAVCSQRPQHE